VSVRELMDDDVALDFFVSRVMSTLDQLRAENALLRKALERFLETTEGEDAVSGMALHGPITLARAALDRTQEKP
jgi:hypothetical protein